MPFEEDPPTQKRRGGSTFVLDDYLGGMDEATAKGARRWLFSHGSHREIAEKFTAEGFPVSQGAVQGWRAKNGWKAQK